MSTIEQKAKKYINQKINDYVVPASWFDLGAEDARDLYLGGARIGFVQGVIWAEEQLSKKPKAKKKGIKK